MSLDIELTEVKTDFKFDVCPSEQTLTIVKGNQTIILTYWECMLLSNILEKQLN